jgi:hypothetical protein
MGDNQSRSGRISTTHLANGGPFWDGVSSHLAAPLRRGFFGRPPYLAGSVGVDHLDLQRHRAGRRFHVSQHGLGIRLHGRGCHPVDAGIPWTDARRAPHTVTIADRLLQSAGLIRYQRGLIHIVDRAALEDTACEC